MLRHLPALLPLFLALACREPAPSAPLAAPAREALALPALEPDLAARLQALSERLENQRQELHIPGFALAIVQDDRLVYARGFGQADVEHARAVTPETIFAIGSTSKAFTATLVGMLADEQRLSFDAPVTEYLPWFELPIEGQGPVLVRDLLSHRTGFARMDILWYGGHATRTEVLRTALGAEPMAPFRKEFHYNNIMFLAAGEICAQVGGRSWEEQIQTRLFEPLGMHSSSTSVAVAQRDPRLALGYQWNEERQRFEHKPMRDLSAIAPAGAINSNVLDLSRWLRFLLNEGELEGKRLISRERLGETWQENNRMAPGRAYGLGWMLARWNGEPVIEHGGNIDGFGAEIALLPGRRTGLVLLTNVTATPLQGSIWGDVFTAMHGEPAAKDAAGAQGPGADEDLTRFTGTYLANFFQFKGAEFRVLVRADGKLAVDIPGQTVFEMLPPDEEGKRAFALVPAQIQASFSEVDGQVVALTLHQNGMDFECFRAGYEPPAVADPAEFEPYLGLYADPLTSKTFALVVQHGRLAVDYPEQMVYELHPPDDEGRWVFRPTPLLALEFQLDADGRAEAVTFHERGTKRVCERVGDAPKTLPTLDELLVLRRAQGFEARLAELGVCRLTSDLRFVHCGIRGTSTLTFDGRGRFREQTDLAPFVETTTTCDGERAVAESSLAATQELPSAGRDQALAGLPPAMFGDWRTRFDQARVERVVHEAQRSLAVVVLEKGKAPPLRVHVDLASGELVRADMRELVEGVGSLPRTLRFEAWSEHDGLWLPDRVVSEDEATGRVVSEFTGFVGGLPESALGSLPALPE